MFWYMLCYFNLGVQVTRVAMSTIAVEYILSVSVVVSSLVFVLAVYVLAIRQTASVWRALARRFPAADWPKDCRWHGAGSMSRLIRERRVRDWWLRDVESGPCSLLLGVSRDMLYVTPTWWRRIALPNPLLASIPFECCRTLSCGNDCGNHEIEVQVGSRNVFTIQISSRMFQLLQQRARGNS